MAEVSHGGEGPYCHASGHDDRLQTAHPRHSDSLANRNQLWEPPRQFVDEQVRGPYRLWVHEHTFEPQDGGTLMRDHVHYSVRFDFIVHRLLVKPDIERIFAFRTEALRQRFGENSPSSGR